jgi:hypothetical protein
MLLRSDTTGAHQCGMKKLGSPDNGTMIGVSYCIITQCSEDDNYLVNVTPPFQTRISG